MYLCGIKIINQLNMITLSRKTFLDGLLLGGSMTSKKAPCHYMTQVRCDLNESSLTIASCNAESYIESTIEVAMSTEGKLSFSFFPTEVLSLLRSISDEEVTLNFENNSMRIDYSTGEITMPIDCSDSFAKPNMDDMTDFVTIPSDQLGGMLREAKDFVGDNVAKGALMGVFVDIHDGKLHVTSSDGAYLYANSVVCPHNIAPMQGIVKAVGGILDVLATNYEAELCIGRHRLYVRTSEALFCTLLIDSRYPAYERIIPTSFRGNMLTNTNALMNAVKRVSLFSERDTNKINFSIEFGRCDINAADEYKAYSSREALDVMVQGEPVSFSLSSPRVLTALRSMNCEKLKVSYNDVSSPVVFRDSEDDAKTILILPMA